MRIHTNKGIHDLHKSDKVCHEHSVCDETMHTHAFRGDLTPTFIQQIPHHAQHNNFLLLKYSVGYIQCDGHCIN